MKQSGHNPSAAVTDAAAFSDRHGPDEPKPGHDERQQLSGLTLYDPVQ
jgi:hypothetical protein